MLYNLVTRIVDKLKEATVSDIARKQRTITSLFPAHPGRVEKVGHMGGVRLGKLGTETWHFKIHSGTKKSTWYDAVVHFSNITGTLNKLVMDKRLWVKDQSKVDLRLLAGEFRSQSEVKIECNCPCQQFWGFNYILSKDQYNAKYGSAETRSPSKRNPRQYGAICKHLDALFKSLPFYNSTIARWLNDFYGKDIQELEALANKESEKFKKAGKELGKKVEPKKEEKPKQEPKAKEKPAVKEPIKEPEPEKEETKESIKEAHEYYFETDCASSTKEKIDGMVKNSKNVSRKEFIENVNLDGMTLYGENVTSMMTTYPDDFDYFKSTYDGKPAYYFVWSAIEHVFIKESKVNEYDIKDIDTECPSCGHGIKSGIKICPVCHKILDKSTTYLSREWNKVTPKYTPEAELRGLGESVDYSGVKALYKVYHDVERNIDPSPEDIWTALDMMEDYYDGYLDWYKTYAKHKIHAEDSEIYKAYVKRGKEIRAAKAGKDPGEALVALDTAINQWHRDYPVIAHLSMESGEADDEAGEIEKWLEDVGQILSRLGRLPENSPYADELNPNASQRELEVKAATARK